MNLHPLIAWKLVYKIASGITGASIAITFSCALIFAARAQTPYDLRQDDHMRSIDKHADEVETQRKDRRDETLGIRAKQDARLDEIDQRGRSNFDEIQGRLRFDEGMGAGAMGVLTILQTLNLLKVHTTSRRNHRSDDGEAE